MKDNRIQFYAIKLNFSRCSKETNNLFSSDLKSYKGTWILGAPFSCDEIDIYLLIWVGIESLFEGINVGKQLAAVLTASAIFADRARHGKATLIIAKYNNFKQN